MPTYVKILERLVFKAVKYTSEGVFSRSYDKKKGLTHMLSVIKFSWLNIGGELRERVNPPDSSLHQSHGKNTQQAHVAKQHDPLKYPTMGDQGKSSVDPAWIFEL